MPKVTLTYSLPEEQEQLEEALFGAEWRYSLQQLDNELRQRIKHGDIHPERRFALETARDLLYEVLGERGLDLFD